MHRPDILILDEPTSGLDPNQIRDIRSLIRELGESHGIILSTHILPEVHLESLVETLQDEIGEGPCVVIADSVQTLHGDQVDSYPGSPTQIRYCGGVLADFARRTRCPVFLVGHVTKTGDLAGPKLLEHMVDTVLYFEGSGGGAIRMVRAVKNRFGTTGELAVLEMRQDGLVPVDARVRGRPRCGSRRGGRWSPT